MHHLPPKASGWLTNVFLVAEQASWAVYSDETSDCKRTIIFKRPTAYFTVVVFFPDENRRRTRRTAFLTTVAGVKPVLLREAISTLKSVY